MRDVPETVKGKGGKTVEKIVRKEGPSVRFHTIPLAPAVIEGLVKGARFDMDCVLDYARIKAVLPSFGKIKNLVWNFSSNRTAVKLTAPESPLTVYTLPLISF
jgi:hypothetical protein